MTINAFQKKIYVHYKKEKRSLPWRKTHNPYKILVSEVMLQQTQVSRVISKYEEFLKKFPTINALANAKTQEVLFVWQGLGYNRRALQLQKAAKEVIENHSGVFPKTYEALLALHGIGPYTASAIMAFAYNKPATMIETNIRAAFIHSFFSKAKKVPDKKLLPLIEKYMDIHNPRQWYNALMDYGAMLKRTHPNPSRQSFHHTIQSKFQGSVRQVRGAIIKEYTKDQAVTKRALARILPYEKNVIMAQYEKLRSEGFFI